MGFIINMNTLNFKANFINPVQIQKLDGNNYKPVEASFTELNLQDKKDIFSLKEASQDWGECYATDMYICSRDEVPDGNKKHIYALTTQKQNFEYLKPDNILGLVEFYEKPDKTNKIELLQVHPDNIAMQFGRPKYKRVGSAIIDSLKNLFPNNPIKLHSVSTAKGFYKKLGFVPDKSSYDSLDYIWNG